MYGFKAVFTRPLAWGAELAWRWVSSLTLWLIVLYTFFSYLHSLPVSDTDRFMLSGVVPGLAAEGVRHIIAGSGGRLLKLILLVSAAWSVLWWAAASLGRSATLLDMTETQNSMVRRNFKFVLTAISRIHAIRIALNVASTMAYCGVIVLAEVKSRVPVVDLHETQGVHTHRSGEFWTIFIGLSLLVSLATVSLRWYLSLAPIFCVQYGVRVRDAVRMAAGIGSKRAQNFSWVGFAHWAIRLVLNLCLIVPGFTLLGVIAHMPKVFVWIFVIVGMMAWSAVGHFLGLSQLASWMRIIKWDEEERNKPTEPLHMPAVARPLLDSPIVPAM